MTNSDSYTLIIENISRKDNFIYDLQLQVSVNIKDNILNEEFLIFTFDVDLTDIKIVEAEKFPLWAILVIVFGSLIIMGIVFLIIKYIRLHKKTSNLEEEVKSMAYTNQIQKNVIAKEKQYSKNYTDYDTTFI